MIAHAYMSLFLLHRRLTTLSIQGYMSAPIPELEALEWKCANRFRGHDHTTRLRQDVSTLTIACR
jgi:hypothetical protein